MCRGFSCLYSGFIGRLYFFVLIVMDYKRILINVIDTTWRSEFAYAVGLIASDGCLRKDTMEVRFVSKELEMIRLYKKSLRHTQKSQEICPRRRDREKIL